MSSTPHFGCIRRGRVGGKGEGKAEGHYARLKLVFEAACWEDGCVCSKEENRKNCRLT